MMNGTSIELDCDVSWQSMEYALSLIGRDALDGSRIDHTQPRAGIVLKERRFAAADRRLRPADETGMKQH